VLYHTENHLLSWTCEGTAVDTKSVTAGGMMYDGKYVIEVKLFTLAV